MAELVLIRGLPGSGKSTIAKNDYSEHVHFEADMFFVANDGGYNYEPKRIRDAHKWCQDMARNALSMGRNVVVSNTFTRLWEMEEYKKMAVNSGASVIVIVASGNYKNVHDVPESVITNMRERWEDGSPRN